MNEERYKKLKASAQRYTAYRERAPKEVADKLKEWSAPEAVISRILEDLRKDKFIDEERFSRAYCHDKFLINKWGKNRLRMELSKYQISESAKNAGLAYINDEVYAETLKHLANSKWDKLKDPDLFKKKQKTARYLLQKGFESELVWDVINDLS